MGGGQVGVPQHFLDRGQADFFGVHQEAGDVMPDGVPAKVRHSCSLADTFDLTAPIPIGLARLWIWKYPEAGFFAMEAQQFLVKLIVHCLGLFPPSAAFAGPERDLALLKVNVFPPQVVDLTHPGCQGEQGQEERPELAGGQEQLDHIFLGVYLLAFFFDTKFVDVKAWVFVEQLSSPGPGKQGAKIAAVGIVVGIAGAGPEIGFDKRDGEAGQGDIAAVCYKTSVDAGFIFVSFVYKPALGVIKIFICQGRKGCAGRGRRCRQYLFAVLLPGGDGGRLGGKPGLGIPSAVDLEIVAPALLHYLVQAHKYIPPGTVRL